MRLVQIVTVPLFLGIVGCDHCYNVECNEPDVAHINGLQFAFDPSSFSYEDVNNATVLRFHPGNFEHPLDTLFLKDMMSEGDLTFTISPETADADGRVSDVYGIYDNSHEHAYMITDIVTDGIHPADCCCCYENIRKTYLLNGSAVDRTGSTEPVLLSK